ncbi:MAG: hypothetical protein RR450_01825 [Oscillospiraceae bacterium]
MSQSAKRVLGVAVTIVLMVALLLSGVWFLSREVSDEALATTQKNIARAALQCYSLEGFYPESLSYLREHYGVQVDEKRFFVDYVPVASNLMPQITVLPRD